MLTTKNVIVFRLTPISVLFGRQNESTCYLLGLLSLLLFARATENTGIENAERSKSDTGKRGIQNAETKLHDRKTREWPLCNAKNTLMNLRALCMCECDSSRFRLPLKHWFQSQ